MAWPSGQAKLRWTDERTETYGVIDANDDDLAALYEAGFTQLDTRQAE